MSERERDRKAQERDYYADLWRKTQEETYALREQLTTERQRREQAERERDEAREKAEMFFCKHRDERAENAKLRAREVELREGLRQACALLGNAAELLKVQEWRDQIDEWMALLSPAPQLSTDACGVNHSYLAEGQNDGTHSWQQETGRLGAKHQRQHEEVGGAAAVSGVRTEGSPRSDGSRPRHQDGDSGVQVLQAPSQDSSQVASPTPAEPAIREAMKRDGLDYDRHIMSRESYRNRAAPEQPAPAGAGDPPSFDTVTFQTEQLVSHGDYIHSVGMRCSDCFEQRRGERRTRPAPVNWWKTHSNRRQAADRRGAKS